MAYTERSVVAVIQQMSVNNNSAAKFTHVVDKPFPNNLSLNFKLQGTNVDGVAHTTCDIGKFVI